MFFLPLDYAAVVIVVALVVVSALGAAFPAVVVVFSREWLSFVAYACVFGWGEGGGDDKGHSVQLQS